VLCRLLVLCLAFKRVVPDSVNRARWRDGGAAHASARGGFLEGRPGLPRPGLAPLRPGVPL